MAGECENQRPEKPSARELNGEQDVNPGAILPVQGLPNMRYTKLPYPCYDA